MTSTETLIRALADRAELADLVARHSLWIFRSAGGYRHACAHYASMCAADQRSPVALR